MTTILVATMNVNQPKLTDNLVNQIRKDTNVDFEIMVLENGATEPSSYSTHTSEKNYFFGGGLNLILDYYLNSTSHEWLMVLNNDLIFHGEKYLSTMISEAITHDVAVLSPAVINASMEQCAWKQMHLWMTGTTRLVDWIDFQAPLLRRDICQHIGQYPMELIYGWGNDFFTGIIAKQNNLKVGVTDKVCVTHLNSQTMNKGVHDLDGNFITPNEYCRRAESGMYQYMINSNLWSIFEQFKYNAAHYSYEVTT